MSAFGGKADIVRRRDHTFEISLQICEVRCAPRHGPFKLSIENQLVSDCEGPALSIQGSDSEPGVLLAKQQPKVPAALHEPLAEPPLEPDRLYLPALALPFPSEAQGTKQTMRTG